MDKKEPFNINLNSVDLFNPLIAGHILNALYSALLLKQQQGIEITPEVHKETLKEITMEYFNLQLSLQAVLKKAPPPGNLKNVKPS